MFKIGSLLLLFISFHIHGQELNIIPRPVKASKETGNFILTKSTVLILSDDGELNSANFLNDYLQKFYGFKLRQGKDAKTNFIRLVTRRFIQPGEDGKYEMQVKPGYIHIEGDTYDGTFHGIQTLIQLLPVQPSSSLKIPCASIIDRPRFAYRGLHLDVGRHFMPVDFVKKYIDFIALHKMNYFHWHLTEDQGWRIEIKKYPLLTKVGAFRNGTIIGRYPGKGNDNIRYGGFYTQDQIKDVVEYASKRFITIVPEIELPGHGSAAIAAYPWLSCFPEEKTRIADRMISEASKNANGKVVQETWGVHDDIFCAGNDTTFGFLQDVVDEVIALFPGNYFHVGGDECPKNNWKRCPRCQARIKANNLKDEHELQSYFITRMEKYINSRGKTVIGWDEILEGGLAPNAIVMSWRGEQGGIDAARQNHKVIMSPGNFVYLDHSQTKNEDSVTIGGYTPVDETYNYEPLPKELAADKTSFILGAQANVWTEYMNNSKKIEYMIFPRLSAMSEVLWTAKDKRDFKNFEKRLPVQMKRYELWKANYSRAYYDVKASVIPAPNRNGVVYKLESGDPKNTIIYKEQNNLNESLHPTPDKTYKSPVLINRDKLIRASIFSNGKRISSILTQKFSINKATGKKITLASPPLDNYPGNGGAFGLVNGARSEKGINSPEWLGWRGTDMETIIDFEKEESISKVGVHACNTGGSRVYPPAIVEVFISDDGQNFSSLGSNTQFEQDASGTSGNITISFGAIKTRYIKVVARNYAKIPEGRTGAGDPALMLIDEISVN